ncbi:MAG: cyclophilin-like fold protein [Alphaproteobacteria bacterium]
MTRTIEISAANVVLRATLRDTPTADAIWDALPLSATAQTWGEEVYFDCGLACASEADAKAVVEAGEIAYWPDGTAVAIGFGPTPISEGNEIRLASPTNIWADANDDVRNLSVISAGTPIDVRRA